MRATVMRRKSLLVTDLPVPQPGPGEVLVKTLACGICGSDLHALKHAEKLVESARRSGGPFVMDLSRDIVMGHEFCAEIVEHGPETTKALKAGTRVCSLPVLIRPSGVETVGYSNDNPGGYGEYMRLTEALLLEVPGGLSAEHAALPRPPPVTRRTTGEAPASTGGSPRRCCSGCRAACRPSMRRSPSRWRWVCMRSRRRGWKPATYRSSSAVVRSAWR